MAYKSLNIVFNQRPSSHVRVQQLGRCLDSSPASEIFCSDLHSAGIVFEHYLDSKCAI